MSGHRLKIHFTFNVVGKIIPVAIALVTVPLYISYIGAARYGVLSIVWLLVGYFGFLDFGLSRASTNALAKLGHATKEERSRVLITSLYLNLGLGLLGGIILYFAGLTLLHHMVSLSDVTNAELESAFPWIAYMIPIALLGGVARGAIQSRERFFDLNVLDLINFSLGQILPIVCAVTISPSLTVVIPATFVARALAVGLNLGWVVRLEKLSTIMIFDLTRFKELLGFGVWVTVTNVIGPILASMDRLLVGSVLGAVAVAHYAVPMNLVTRGQVLSEALATTLFPLFSRLKLGEARLLAEKAVISLSYGFGAMCGPAIIIGGPFLTLWLGGEFASHATPVIQLLLVGAWFNGIAYIPYSFLQGQGRPDLVAKLHLLEFPPFIVALYFLLYRFGLVGAALAWCGRVTIDSVFLLCLSRFSLYRLLVAIPALILILISYTITQISDISIFLSGLLAGLILLTFVGCGILFDTTAREMFTTVSARAVETVRRGLIER